MMIKRPSPFDALSEPASLMQAWKQVRANKGAPGIDLISIAEFERDLQTNLEALSSRLREGRYYPMPVRTVEMRKANGGIRTLGILTVEDRIVQRAALDAVEPLFEPAFLDCSFGFRPNRSVEHTVQRVLDYRAGGDEFIVDADIADCFGSLDHDLLMQLVSARIKDKRLLALIRMWLDTGQVLPRTPREQSAANRAPIFDRMVGYINDSFDSAITHLLDERGYGSYGYTGLADYGAGTIYGNAGEQSDATNEAHRLARKEALKRLGRDGTLLLLTYSNRLRRLLSPTALALTGAAALATAAYPLANRAIRHWSGARRGSGVGAVQGGSLSPLLCNIYLHQFDVAMTKAGLHLARYADDFVILCRDEARAREAMELAARKLAELRLRLSPQKTRILRFDAGLEFLGYRFDPLAIAASPASPLSQPALNGLLRNAPEALGHARAKIASSASKFAKGAARYAGKGASELSQKLKKWKGK
jgi:RNA-directed DNA polymerase